MEILRQSENFTLSNINEIFELTGNISRDVNGALNIHFNVHNNSGEHIGDGHYNKYNESSNINFSINCSEEIRKELTEYAETTIDDILAYFNIEK